VLYFSYCDVAVLLEFIVMATTVVSADAISKEERSLVVSGLIMKRASILRASKVETNSQVIEIRAKEVDEINKLITKFS